ncbi:hypothetical protein [Bacillus pinisoli]|uniref:hypothetical protein n=1 Tax=Bacillus pinisoli TaxID=2901866 RepID=UPI001FF22B85|nr:hypothetical protein [Bacillus pinisoli]
MTINKTYNQFDDIANDVLRIANHVIGTRSFFISRITEGHFSVLKTLNDKGSLLEEGDVLPFDDVV